MAYNGAPREWLQTLGERLAEARDIAGLTQEQLATRVKSRTDIHVTRNQIAQYETGLVDPPSSKLDAIAIALGIEVSELTGRRRLNPLAIALNDDNATEEDKEIAQAAAYGVLEARKKRRMDLPE